MIKMILISIFFYIFFIYIMSDALRAAIFELYILYFKIPVNISLKILNNIQEPSKTFITSSYLSSKTEDELLRSLNDLSYTRCFTAIVFSSFVLFIGLFFLTTVVDETINIYHSLIQIIILGLSLITVINALLFWKKLKEIHLKIT